MRQAIQMSLDRAAIGVSDLAGIPWPAKPLNNHIFVENYAFYADNSDPWGIYDPDAAMALLEENGWVDSDGDGVREKDGQPLTRPPLADRRRPGVGERGSADPEPARRGRHRGRDRRRRRRRISATSLTAGDFEMMAFSWIGTPFPFRGVAADLRQRLGQQLRLLQHPRDRRVDRPAVDHASTRPSGRPSANEIDQILWEYGHTIPLYQRPELVANRSDLANFGAFGFQTPAIWTDVGYM